MQLKEIVDLKITSLKRIVKMNSSQEELLRLLFLNTFREGFREAMLTSLGITEFCPTCETSFTDEANKEAVKHTGMCCSCDHAMLEAV